MAALFDTGIFSTVSASGAALAGAKLYWYAAGTTTPAATYSDIGLTTPNANPVVADSNGRFGPIWLAAQNYKFVLKTATDVTIVTRDFVAPAVPAPGLAASGGSALIGHMGQGTGATLVNLQTLLRRTLISPIQFGATGDGTANDTAGIQAAIDYCVANYPTASLDLSGTWRASKLSVSGGNGLHIIGNGVITANSGSTQTCLFEVAMPGVINDGAIKLNVGYRTNYECGLHIYATGGSGTNTCQFSRYGSITINSAKIGVRIGNETYPSALASELTLTGLSTYGCPVPVEVIGAETYVTLSDPLISADDFGGDAAWQALPKRGVRIIGGDVIVTGGEVVLTADNNEALFEVQPITGDTEGTFYGSLRVIGTTCETASPLAITTNPDALTISSVYGRRGLLQFTDCRGYHGENLASFITTDATFQGDVIIKGNRFWHGGTRTQNNITCGSTGTHVYMDDMGFGDGFKLPFSGVSGGTCHFGRRTLIKYQDPQSQSLSIGANTIVFKVPTGNDTVRWEANYSTTTGIWGAPETIANLSVRGQVAFTAAASGNIQIVDNSTPVATVAFTSQTEVSVDWSTMNYASGRTLKIVVNLTGAGATVNSSGFLSYFTIEGRN